MNYSDRQFDYSDLNQRRFQPLSIEISEQNVQEGTLEIISILEKEKQAAKEIFNQTEKLAYLEFIDREIERHRELLNWPSSTSQTAQSNEMLNTGKRTIEGQNKGKTIEKINWKSTEAQLVFFIELLTQEGLLEYGRHWKMIEEHFLVKGKSLKHKQLAQTFQNLPVKGPKNAQILESILSQVTSSED